MICVQRVRFKKHSVIARVTSESSILLAVLRLNVEHMGVLLVQGAPSVGQQKVFKFNPLEQIQPGIVGAVEVEGNSGVGRREGETVG